MPRTIIIGDVHGCADELAALLERLAFTPADRVVLTGDLVGRGPQPGRAVALARSIGARAVQGNHEAHLLRWTCRDPAGGVVPTAAAGRHAPYVAQLAAELAPQDWSYLEALPLWLELPEHELLVVHAGIQPGVALAAQRPEVLTSIRCLAADGTPVLERGDQLWAARYTGPPHVVFGHHALDEPQLHRWATGLDTGCVYGGRLTALVLEADDRVPPPDRRPRALVSVPAGRAYHPI